MRCLFLDGSRAVALPLAEDGDGTLSFEFEAGAGLLQLSVIADASEFDWSELYFKLDRYGNHGELTGPWDFDLRDGNKPLMPAYWFELDGRRVGLWFFQRVLVGGHRGEVLPGTPGVPCFGGRTPSSLSHPISTNPFALALRRPGARPGRPPRAYAVPPWRLAGKLPGGPLARPQALGCGPRHASDHPPPLGQALPEEPRLGETTP